MSQLSELLQLLSEAVQHRHSPGVIRQVAAVITTGKNKGWKFTPEFQKNPSETLSKAFGIAVDRGKRGGDSSASSRPGWDVRLAQYEKALEIARKSRKSAASAGKIKGGRRERLAASVSAVLQDLEHALVG